MKKNVMRFSAIACLLIATFMCASCIGQTFSYDRSLFIELCDENGNIITKKEELLKFSLSIIDNYTGSKAEGKILIHGDIVTASGKVGSVYYVYFHMGIGNFESTKRIYERKLNKQMEKTGIRIEDKNGRYKTSEIYPLSGYKDGACIIVKLEKK